MTNFYFTESQIFARYSPKYMKYNVCSIKREQKMTSWHKTQIENVESFLLNKYAVHDF